MSQVAGSSTQVVPDTLTNALLIRMPGDGVSVQAEEVIQRLESDGLAPRTRKRIRGIDDPVIREEEITLRVRFEGLWDCSCELDVRDTLSSLYAERMTPSCV